MSNAQDRLHTAMKYALEHRPTVGGFPFLAECLRQAGVEKNVWTLPAAQSLYVMKDGMVVQMGAPLVSGMTEVPAFSESALVAALCADQAGQSTFPEFLRAAWLAGVVGYEVDFVARRVSYFGARRETYHESYPAVVMEGVRF